MSHIILLYMHIPYMHSAPFVHNTYVNWNASLSPLSYLQFLASFPASPAPEHSYQALPTYTYSHSGVGKPGNEAKLFLPPISL